MAAQGGDDADADGGGPLAGLWPALLVALVAALLAWLWGGGGGDGQDKGAAAGEAEAAPGAPRQQQQQPPPRREEPLQGSCNCPASETKPNDVSVCPDPVRDLLVSLGEYGTPRETPEIEPAVKVPVTLTNCKEYPRNEAFHFPASASEPPKKDETETRGLGAPAGAGSPRNTHELKCGEQLQPNCLDQEEWEIVPEHSAGAEAARNVGVKEASGSKEPEQAKRVAAVSPIPQTVRMTFRVHYITYSEARLIGVTGDHECLGQWLRYVPLRCEKDGFWSDSVALPADTRVEWKFIVVENGKVRRWEECDNRTLMTEHEDRVVHKWWGYH